VLVEAEILGSTGRGRRRVDLEMLQDPPVVRTPEQKEGREGCCQLCCVLQMVCVERGRKKVRSSCCAYRCCARSADADVEGRGAG
jgi:hypothetical protein